MAERARFDTLFLDPRHYRGDCRLVRTAVRRGWLNGEPRAVRDALVERFERAAGEREPADPNTLNLRALFAEIGVAMAMQRDNLDRVRRALGVSRGRPRTRSRRADLGRPLDANAMRRELLAAGADGPGFAFVTVEHGAGDDRRVESVSLTGAQSRTYGFRCWYTCPRCGARRRFLYIVKAGIGCRGCLRIRYADRRAPNSARVSSSA